MKKRNLLISMIVVAGLLGWSIQAHAKREESWLVKSGMTYGEVQQILGPPKERIEYESKREDLWQYRKSEIRFRNGQVLSVSAESIKTNFLSAASVAQSPDEKIAQTDVKLDQSHQKKKAAAIPVKEILSEIMQGSSSSKKITGPPRPGVASLIRK